MTTRGLTLGSRPFSLAASSVERSFSVGVGNQVRLYEIDLAAATDILTVDSLMGATYTQVCKPLVLDFDTLASELGGIGNLEGITFGPALARGHDSLVVAADDNFSTVDRTEYIPISSWSAKSSPEHL